MNTAPHRRQTGKPHRTILHRILVVIGVTTVATGATQVAVPGTVLSMIGGRNDRTTRHLFATVGMFMVVIGGLFVHALRARRPSREVVTWAAVQKAGAAAAVGIGVARGVFTPIALLVAAFDGLTAVLMAVYRSRET